MLFKKIALCGAMLFSTSAMIAHAEINITNNTNATGVAKINGLCSGIIEKGKIKPHSVFTVPDDILKQFCNPNCKAQIYMNDTLCTGSAFASVNIDMTSGVTGYTNHDEKHYTISGMGEAITVDPASSWKNWFDWLK